MTDMASDATAAQVVMSLCTKHVTEEMDMYCHVCKKATCTRCMTTDHICHDMDTIAKFSRKLTINRAKFLTDLTAIFEHKRRRKTRQFREVKCHNDCVLSNNVKSLEERRKQLHQVVDELINKQLNICQSHNAKFFSRMFRKLEEKHNTEDCQVEKMLSVFEKTSMTGLDIIEYYEDLRLRVVRMESCVDTNKFLDRLVYREGNINKNELERMVGAMMDSSEMKQDDKDEMMVSRMGKTLSLERKAKETTIVSRSPEQLSSFHFQDSKVQDICPVSQDEAWISYKDNKKYMLINKDGKQQESVPKEADNAGFFVTDDRSIINCDYHKQVVQRIDHSGKTTNIMNTSPLWPVTVGKALNGNILVTLVEKWSRSRTADSKRIALMLTPEGEEIQSYEFDQDGATPALSFPTRPAQNFNSNICVLNHFAVAPNTYKANVCVFYEDGGLKFVYSGQNEDFDPEGICFDSLSNILCADFNANTVHILNSEGEFLRYLLTSESCVSMPRSIALFQSVLWVGSGGGEIRVYRYLE